jgi:predicted RNase H-like HicB family nuclease
LVCLRRRLKSRLNGRGILDVVKIGGKGMEYTVLVYRAEEGGFWAEVPALPGCYSQGETIEETLENVKEAIEAHLLALKEEREEVPTEEEFVIGRVKVGVSAVV